MLRSRYRRIGTKHMPQCPMSIVKVHVFFFFCFWRQDFLAKRLAPRSFSPWWQKLTNPRQPILLLFIFLFFFFWRLKFLLDCSHLDSITSFSAASKTRQYHIFNVVSYASLTNMFYVLFFFSYCAVVECFFFFFENVREHYKNKFLTTIELPQ